MRSSAAWLARVPLSLILQKSVQRCRHQELRSSSTQCMATLQLVRKYDLDHYPFTMSAHHCCSGRGCQRWHREGRRKDRHLPVCLWPRQCWNHLPTLHCRIQETLSQDILDLMHAPKKPDYPILPVNDLANFDAFVMGIPTRYGNFPTQWKVGIYHTP